MKENELVQPALDKLIPIIEMERFLMGLGKYAFAKQLGVTYHTYNMFITRRQMINASTFFKLLKFVEARGKNIMGNAEKLVVIERFEKDLDNL